MRGSQFQNLSVTEAVTKDKEYRRHQKKVETIAPRIVAEDQLNDQMKLFNSYSLKTHLKHKFKSKQRKMKEENENAKMLQVFHEIDKGKQLAVGKADYKESMTKCPVLEQHSLNVDARKRELTEIDRQNHMLMNKIINPNHSVRNSDLKKQWDRNRGYHDMISKANRQSGFAHSLSRINYLKNKESKDSSKFATL